MVGRILRCQADEKMRHFRRNSKKTWFNWYMPGFHRWLDMIVVFGEHGEIYKIFDWKVCIFTETDIFFH